MVTHFQLVWFSEQVSTHILLHKTPETHPVLAEEEPTLGLLLSLVAFGVATAFIYRPIRVRI